MAHYCTMVMRSGDPKGHPNAMSYTLIADNFKVTTLDGSALATAIKNKQLNVVNMGIDATGKLVSTNGSIDNYTTFENGAVVGNNNRDVVLGRIERDGELGGYYIFSTSGIVRKVSIEDAAKLAKGKGLANGKPRPVDGGYIVSAIGGSYPIISEVSTKEKPKEPKIEIMFIGSAIKNTKTPVRYGGIVLRDFDNAMYMTKFRERLEETSEKLRTYAKASLGFSNEIVDSLKTQVIDGAGFYGVYPIGVIEKLAREQNGLNPVGKKHMIVACTDCDNSFRESTAGIILDKRQIELKESSTEDADKYAKKLAEYVMEKILKK